MPVVPFAPRPDAPPSQRTSPIDQTYLLMAAADLHDAGRLFEPPPPPESLSQSVDRMGIVRFAPETYTDPKDQEYMKNLPPDVERIERGNTIELRKRKQEALTS